MDETDTQDPIMEEPDNPDNLDEVSDTPPFMRTSPISPRSPSPAKGSVRSNTYSKTSKNSQDVLIPSTGKTISDHVEELSDTVKQLSRTIQDPQSPILENNVDKIAKMSKILTSEANALRESIRTLSEDITRTKNELTCGAYPVEDVNVNFPYHLFLIELVVNKIHMKCDCFGLDGNNLVISAKFLGKSPIILYDASYGEIYSFSKLNVGKSTLFAMTYDKICHIQEFIVVLELTKEPPCSSCITKIAHTRMDYSAEFAKLREELCKKWIEEKPNDNIICTTASPLTKNLFYLSCPNAETQESIGVIEVSARMSFLGKEITTAFSASPAPHGTSVLQKEDNGMMMYSSQKVEMDDQGKILLDEHSMDKKPMRYTSPVSTCSGPQAALAVKQPQHNSYGRYDEISTKMNDNELKIRVPKSTKVERMGYDKIAELCSCESTPYNTGDQVQFEMPPDLCFPDKSHRTYTSNLKYSYKGCDRSCEKDKKDKKIINVTPTNCPVPVDMQKVMHPQKDVFILKIGKKLETKDRKTDLEIELITPKVNDNLTTAATATQSDEKPKKCAVKKPPGNKEKKGKKGGKKEKKTKK